MENQPELEKNVTPTNASLKEQITTVTPFSKYLALALFILLPFFGAWIGYGYGLKNTTIDSIPVTSERVSPEDPMQTGVVDGSTVLAGEQNNNTNYSKALLFQFGCDAPSCLLLNTINTKDLVSEKVERVAGGYLNLYGSINKDTIFITTVQGELYIINLSAGTDSGNNESITTASFGFGDGYEFQAIRSLGDALYMLIQKQDYSAQRPLVTDSKLVTYDLGSKNFTAIEVPFMPDGLYSNFIGSNKDYVYVTNSDPTSGNLSISAFDTVTKKIVDTRVVAGCSDSDLNPSTPCENTYNEFKKLMTYSCGDTTVSQLYTQDGSSSISLKNMSTGYSTTSVGVFAMCTDY